MRRSVIGDNILNVIAVTLFGLCIIGYALFVSYPYLFGAHITFTSPADGSTNATTTVIIAGTTIRVSTLWINGLETPLAPDGTFKLVRALPAGYTVVSATGQDRFGRTVTAQTRFLHAPDETPIIQPLLIATTTATSTYEKANEKATSTDE